MASIRIAQWITEYVSCNLFNTLLYNWTLASSLSCKCPSLSSVFSLPSNGSKIDCEDVRTDNGYARCRIAEHRTFTKFTSHVIFSNGSVATANILFMQDSITYFFPLYPAVTHVSIDTSLNSIILSCALLNIHFDWAQRRRRQACIVNYFKSQSSQRPRSFISSSNCINHGETQLSKKTDFACNSRADHVKTYVALERRKRIGRLIDSRTYFEEGSYD